MPVKKAVACGHGHRYYWVITIGELLRGGRPKTPPLLLPYIPATRAAARPSFQGMLTDDAQ